MQTQDRERNPRWPAGRPPYVVTGEEHRFYCPKCDLRWTATYERKYRRYYHLAADYCPECDRPGDRIREEGEHTK